MTAVDLIEKLTLLMPILLAVGATWKFLPGLQKLANEVVIPVINAILTFLIAFGGGATPAHAGILDTIGGFLSVPAQIALSVGYAVFVGAVHDKIIKPWTPRSPYRKYQALKP